MTGIDELRTLAASAKPGVLLSFTGEALLGYLGDDRNPRVLAEPAMTATQVAQAVSGALGMRKVPSEGAVRNWARKGYRGVKLEAVPAGRGYGYTQAAVVEFIEKVRGIRRHAAVATEISTPGGDPAAEIEKYARGRP